MTTTHRDATHLPHHLRTTLFTHNHTQRSLAHTAGISYGYLAEVLAGRKRLGATAAVRIEQALNQPGLADTLMTIQATTETAAARYNLTQETP